MTKEYYTTDEVAKGIDGLPPISKNTLRSLRQKRAIKYSRIGTYCVYHRSWVEDYINKNIVEVTS